MLITFFINILDEQLTGIVNIRKTWHFTANYVNVAVKPKLKASEGLH